MLRSFSYLAATLDRAGHPPLPDGGSTRRATGSSPATATPRAAAVLPATREAQDRQLAMFELEKAFYELRYELDHRPDWVDIPVRSIATLLDARMP